MSTERSNSDNSLENLFSRVSSPNPFTPDWHHQFGEKLCAFPRFLVLPQEGVNLQFWPDLATFVEGPCWSALMYYPGASSASVCVLYWKDAPRWELIQFDDERTVASLFASSYAELLAEIEQLSD